MGGITTGIGLFSGIDSASLIDQLINIQSRPKILAQQRIIQLKSQQSAFLDINSRLNNFKTVAASFRVGNVFSARSVSSNNESVLTATAGSSAVPGSYNFIVDRLVSTQQLLSRGFADLDSSAVGLDSLTFESEAARLDANTALADLNNGDGVTRGKINVNGTEVDLSRAGTVQEVLDAISTVSGISARVENDHLVIDSADPFTITEETGAGILASLGLNPNAGSIDTHTGTSVYSMNDNTLLQSLNDGRGVAISNILGVGVEDFFITVDGTEVSIRIGDIEGQLTDDEGELMFDDEDPPAPINGVISPAVSTIGGVIERINTALSEALLPEVTASINPATGGIDIIDSNGRQIDIEESIVGSTTYTTASDLGILGSDAGGSISGSRILAGLNTKLISSLNGGTGLGATDGLMNFMTQDGSSIDVDVSGLDDINDIINAINTDSDNLDGSNQRVTASVNSIGTGIQIVDNTTGVMTLSITGTGGSDTAAALGISGSFSTGTAAGSNLQLAYISEATLLADLNNGEGIGTGKFEVNDANGIRHVINITSNDKTVSDLLRAISGSTISARINDNGDGILIEDTEGDGIAISIADVTGSVADKLGIIGTASGTDADNFIIGSFEKVIDFDADATLEDIRDAINAANVGASASVINTGIGTSPFRLNITSERSGEDGRFLIDSGGFDLGLDVLNVGNNARVFFGSDEAATGVLLTSSTNQLDGIVQGVTIDLLSRSEEAVEISVSTNTSEIESKVSDFVAAFNSVIEGIDFRSRYDEETETKGILLGDGTLLNLRNSMYSAVRKENRGFTDTYNSLDEVGIRVGSGGKLDFDTEKFREAYAADPEAVENLFTQQKLESNDDDDPNTIDEPTFSQLSVLGQLEEFADAYVTSIGGVLQNRTNALDAQIKIQEDRIESIQKSLDNKRVILQRQFLAMEQAIGNFQTQGSSLSQLAALG